MNTEIEELGTFWYHNQLRESFKSLNLVDEWARSYPMLFDADDKRNARNQAAKGYHFFEWLAAILIYHQHGYLSLVEKYQFKNHSRKQKVLDKLTTPEVKSFLTDHPEFGGVQCPDLCVYKPDYSDWFFVEIKGPTDHLREIQISFFKELEKRCLKPVRIVLFKESLEAFE